MRWLNTSLDNTVFEKKYSYDGSKIKLDYFSRFEQIIQSHLRKVMSIHQICEHKLIQLFSCSAFVGFCQTCIAVKCIVTFSPLDRFKQQLSSCDMWLPVKEELLLFIFPLRFGEMYWCPSKLKDTSPAEGRKELNPPLVDNTGSWIVLSLLM